MATAVAVSASNSLTRVASWDGKSQDIGQVLAAAFEAKDYRDCIKDLQARGVQPLSYIDGLDKVSPCSKTPRLAHSEFLTGHRRSFIQSGATKTMHTSVKENVWNIWDPSHFPRSYIRAQQAWQTAVRFWRIC